MPRASPNERMYKPRGRRHPGTGDRSGDPARNAPVRRLEDVARRLFSCPACGARWVVFDAAGVSVAGVRLARPGDSPAAAVCCERCSANVDGDGTIAGESRAV